MLVNISGSFFEIGQQRTQMFILSFEPYLNSNYKSESDVRKIFYIISMNLLYKVVLKIDVQYSDKLAAPVTSCPSCKRGTTLIILSHLLGSATSFLCAPGYGQWHSLPNSAWIAMIKVFLAVLSITINLHNWLCFEIKIYNDSFKYAQVYKHRKFWIYWIHN